MVDQIRCYMIYQLSLQVKLLDGDVAEIGVWRGGTGKLLSTILSQKTVYLFDTFEGLPEINAQFDEDFHTQGMFDDTSENLVKQYLEDFGNIQIIKGTFPKSVESKKISDKFCFVHVDVDLYQSAYDCLNYFYKLLVVGGVIVFDDYGFGTCPGVKKAVDSFFETKKEFPIYLPSGQCLIIKK